MGGVDREQIALVRGKLMDAVRAARKQIEEGEIRYAEHENKWASLHGWNNSVLQTLCSAVSIIADIYLDPDDTWSWAAPGCEDCQSSD